jgi:hypothetical protein
MILNGPSPDCPSDARESRRVKDSLRFLTYVNWPSYSRSKNGRGNRKLTEDQLVPAEYLPTYDRLSNSKLPKIIQCGFKGVAVQDRHVRPFADL